MIINGVYKQPSAYEDGLWVTLMCPHKYIVEDTLIVEDLVSKEQRKKTGIFAYIQENEDEV